MDKLISPSLWRDPISLWLTHLASSKPSPGTVKLRLYQLRRFANAHHQTEPAEVTLEQLTEWVSTPGWSPSTARSARSALRSFYGWMQLTERRTDDPTRHLPRVSVTIGQPRPAGELTVRRAQQHRDGRVRLMVKLASIQGLRAVEISRVHTDDIIEDLIGYSLRVHGKGDKVRVIPLYDELAREILAQPPGYLFPGRIDGHLSAAYVSKLLSRALPEGVTGHMLRHHAAGKFYTGTGYDLRATQALLGHASVATTQVYTPAIPDQMRLGILAAAS